jgi:archaellum component FlaC
MKRKKLKKLIQKPLRFHHQDIHEELDEIKETINDVKYSLQELREGIDELVKITGMRMSQYDDISR